MSYAVRPAKTTTVAQDSAKLNAGLCHQNWTMLASTTPMSPMNRKVPQALRSRLVTVP